MILLIMHLYSLQILWDFKQAEGPEKASAAEICSVFRSRCCVTWLNSKNNALVQMAAVADKEDAG